MIRQLIGFAVSHERSVHQSQRSIERTNKWDSPSVDKSIEMKLIDPNKILTVSSAKGSHLAPELRLELELVGNPV